MDTLNTWELDLRILAANLDNLELRELSILAFQFCVVTIIDFAALPIRVFTSIWLSASTILSYPTQITQ